MPMLIYVVDRLETAVVDIGPPADWVKVNVQKTVSFLLFVFKIIYYKLYM